MWLTPAWRWIKQLVLGHGDPLKCFSEVVDASTLGHRRPLGIRPVELEQIVGSVGRCHVLDQSFRGTQADKDRYRKVLRAAEMGIQLPAIEVFKVGDEYYVLDGHHRVAVAKQQGLAFIDAEVVEYHAASCQPLQSPLSQTAEERLSSRPIIRLEPQLGMTIVQRCLWLAGRIRSLGRVNTTLTCPHLLPVKAGCPGCSRPDHLQKDSSQ